MKRFFGQSPHAPFRSLSTIYLFAKCQHALGQIFRQIFINAVITSADRGVDAEVSEDLLWDLGDFGEHEFHFDLIRKLAAPHFRNHVLPAIGGPTE
jgi:hypothetical protein